MTQHPTPSVNAGAGADAPARTSVMAILSLICSFICCIPALPVLGVLLGIGSLIGIKRSQGRTKGGGIAITGIILGVVSTIVQVVMMSIFAAPLAIAGWGLGMMTRTTETAWVALETGDVAGVRATMTAAGRDQVTDAQILAFRDAYLAEWGGFISAPTGTINALTSYTKAGPAMAGYQQAEQSYRGQSVVPVVCEFVNGYGPVLMVLEEDVMPQNGSMPAFNWGFIEADGDVVWMAPAP